MLLKKLVSFGFVLVLSVSVYAQDTKTASGIILDTQWKVNIYEYAKKNFIHTAWGIGHSERDYNLALKLAKKDKKHFLTYTEDMRTLKEYENRLSWIQRLMKAIDQDKIVPLFQAIVDSKTNEVVKYEALMRIKESEDDYIVPVHFLDISKENKIYFKLTLIMLEKTFQICRDTNKKFSINLTKDDMINDEIVKFIVNKFEQYNFAHNITFEILESEGIENYNEIASFIKIVKKYGATISIDDFGTGYSNFEYLMKLDFDYLKIDASMIKNIDKDEKSQMVTKTIVEFAQKIGVKTIAEFVSSKSILNKIQELDIDYAQGYYLGEPTTNIDK